MLIMFASVIGMAAVVVVVVRRSRATERQLGDARSALAETREQLAETRQRAANEYATGREHGLAEGYQRAERELGARWVPQRRDRGGRLN